MSQAHLALAVRDEIRALAAYEAKHCNVEWDEHAPAVAPNLYIIVMPGEVRREPSGDPASVEDYEYGIDIAIALRSTYRARDRERDLWVATTKSFYKHFQQINAVVDMNYTTLSAANTLMVTDGEAIPDCDTFVEPLRFERLGPIRPAAAEVFAAVSESQAALIRTIQYRGARRMVAR